MALEDIQKKIVADAEAEKEKLLAEAEKQAEKILEEGQNLVKEYKEEQAKKAQSLAENIERGLIIDARSTLANKILAHKRAKINHVFDQAKKEFCESSEYPNLMKSLVLRAVTSKQEIIILGKDEKLLNDQWLAEVNQACGGHLSFAKEAGHFVGGVRLQDGHSSVNITFDTLLDLLRSDTEKDIADILFRG
ncbi:MAG: V-type ATP synthase subunit E [Brevinema sp.]